MEVGVFDHLDRGAVSLQEFYRARLELVQLYEQAGFYSYHVAEHHGSPIGMAPSPNVLFAALAQRTRRIRFGPLVYVLPLYHPLRLIEEIAMLDHLSGGRMELGFGRGASPIESRIYGADPKLRGEVYDEALELVLNGLTCERLTFHGKYYHFEDVPLVMKPLQRPIPPLWYGSHSPESAEFAARKGMQIVSLDGPEKTRTYTDRYREVWYGAHDGARPLPRLGLGRFIVVGHSDEAAMAVARRAYRRWYHSFYYLMREFPDPSWQHVHIRPPEFDQLRQTGQGVAGSPATVSRFLIEHLAQAGCNYLLGQFAFGDLSLGEARDSLELFVTRVLPDLQSAEAAGAFAAV